MRAIVLTIDGELAALIGIARHPEYAQLFSEYRDSWIPHMKSMTTLRAIKLAVIMVRESRLPVFALADEAESDSGRILTRMGFVHVNDRLFRWPD